MPHLDTSYFFTQFITSFAILILTFFIINKNYFSTYINLLNNRHKFFSLYVSTLQISATKVNVLINIITNANLYIRQDTKYVCNSISRYNLKNNNLIYKIVTDYIMAINNRHLFSVQTIIRLLNKTYQHYYYKIYTYFYSIIIQK